MLEWWGGGLSTLACCTFLHCVAFPNICRCLEIEWY